MKKITFIFLFTYVVTIALHAAYLKDIPKTIYQPDGTKIECFATGDEFFNYLHDADGYTIIQASNGYYYYAIRMGDEVVPSEYLVNQVNPEKAGLQKYAKISKKAYYERVERFNAKVEVRNAPTTGIINNLNVFIRFSDEPEFSEPLSFFDAFYNEPDTHSLKNYYWEVSYNTLEVNTTHFPLPDGNLVISYQDAHPRAYYKPRNGGANPEGYEDYQRTEREHTLLKNAIEYVESQIPQELEIDADGDGYVDNVGFMIYGGVGNWADLLWPHRWSLYSINVQIHGKRVYDYMFMLNDPTYNDVGTLCHEFFHVLGAPDLYHYYDDEAPTPVGGWDIMESSGYMPPSMCGFMKYKYGKWIDEIPEISESGEYALFPLSSPEQNIFKIKSPYSFSEYFVIDYRKKEGLYESYTPGSFSGIVVYRINMSAGNGNAGGPPDEVYVYRPGGNLQNTGQLNNAPLCAESGRTVINDHSNPFSFLYNNGNGGIGGLNISNVGEAGDSIVFYVDILKLVPPENLEYVAGDAYVELKWTRPLTTNPALYNIYRDDVLIGTATSQSYTDNTVSNNVTYSYKITAVYSGDPEGESEPTNTINVTPQAPAELPYAINFENGNESWMINNMIDAWQWGTESSFNFNWLSGNDGSFLGINSAAAGANTHVTGYAISPILNLQDHDYVNLSFDYAFKSWQGNDRLYIKYRVSPIHPFVILRELSQANSWRNISVDLPASVLGDGVQIAFFYDDNNQFGYGAAIDNVSITVESAASDPDFTVDINELCENESVIFTSTSAGSNHEFFWEFGEGAVPSTANTEGPHEVTYISEGNKTVKLTIDNLNAEIKNNLLTVNYLPNAGITFSMSGATINFATSTIVENYFWDFGDGNTSDVQFVSHTYTANGNYLVKLQVSNDCGTSTDSTNISISAATTDLITDQLFNVFPNPNNGSFTITTARNEWKGAMLQIFDLSGKIVYSIQEAGTKITVDNLNAGLYLLKIQHNEKLFYEKIVVK